MMLLTLAPDRAAAHAELILQIDMVTAEIAKDTANPELYLKRGALRREHSEFDLAFADYDKAEAIAPGLPQLDVLRGKLFSDWGWPLSARACLDRYLLAHPKNFDALVLRARVLNRLALNRASVTDYDLALTVSPNPGPDLYVERAQVLMTMA